jgi:hypothetical protein
MIQKFEQFVNESNMAKLAELEQEAIEILDEFDGYYNVSDWELKAQRSLITHIGVDEDGVIHYFAGDIENDKHAEEILPTDDEKIYLLSEFVKLA